MNDRIKKAGKLTGGLLAASMLTPAVAIAQDLDAASADTIIVTATKRGAASAEDIPLSVQALGGDDLAKSGVVDFKDYYHLVSGLAVVSPSPSDKRYVIRGVNATGSGTVGIYLDEVIITGENAQDGAGRQPDIKLFDMERIEFLKGPQGTTFGSSSLSGTIRYITNKPDLNEVEANFTGTLRATKGADIGGEVQAAVSVPLVKDMLAVRVAGISVHQPGYIDNAFDEGANNDNTEAYRISATFAPTDRLQLNAMYMSQDREAKSHGHFYNTDLDGTPLTSYQGQSATRTPFYDDVEMFSGNVEYKADFGTFFATASSFERYTEFNRDASLVLSTVFPGPFPGGVYGAGRSVISQPKNRKLNSYEARFASDWDSPVQLLVGGFIQNETRSFQSAIVPSDSPTYGYVPGFSLDRKVSTEIDEKAIFAEATIDVTSRLHLTGGLRWFDYQIDEVANSIQGVTGGAGSGVGPQLSFSEDGLIGKANLSYDFSDDVLAYAQFSQGFRSGGANDQTAASIANVFIPSGFGSDSLNNYELGLKGAYLDGALVANVAAYYIDWSDLQVQEQASDGNLSFPYRGNGGAAEIYGLELDATLHATENLSFFTVINAMSAELSKDNPNPASGMAGDPINYIPNFTLTVGGEYEAEIPSLGASAFFGGDVVHVGDRRTTIRDTDIQFRPLDDYQLVNLRAGIRNDSWTATLSVTNVANDDTVVDYFFQAPFYPDGLVINQPRTILFTISKDFF